MDRENIMAKREPENGDEVELNALDVLEIARALEQKAKELYLYLAGRAIDLSSKAVFLELAASEMEHEHVFEGLKEHIDTQNNNKTPRPYSMLPQIFLEDLPRDLMARFTGKQDRQEILREAMGFEKDTIALFLALKNMLPSHEQPQIDILIQEELGHLIRLGSTLAQVDKTLRVNQARHAPPPE